MIRLEEKDYEIAYEMTENIGVNCTFAHGVLRNRMPGRVYVDSVVNPTCCFVACAGGKYMAAGDAGNDVFLQELAAFLHQEDNHKVYFDFYGDSPEWIDKLSALLSGHAIPLPRVIYTMDMLKEKKLAELMKLPKGYRLEKMDKELYEWVGRCYDHTVLDQWGSFEKFQQAGLGWFLLDETTTGGGEVSDETRKRFVKNGCRVAAICYPVVAGAGYSELSIVTVQAYQKRGFAQAVCAAYVNDCIKKGLTAIWDAGRENVPSNALALKLGFEKAMDARLIFWHEDRSVIQGYLDGQKFM